MIMKKIYSVKSILGGADYYDEDGKFIGYSVPGIGGGADGCGADDDSGDEYVKELGLGNGVDSGMAVEEN